MDDEAIIELYNRRDEAAVSETQRKYGAYCRRIAMNLLGVGEDRMEALAEQAREAVRDTGVSLLTAVAECVTEPVLYSVLFLLSFAVLMVLLRLLAKLLDLALKLPVLHGANAVGGAVVGLLEGLAVLLILTLVLQQLGVSLEDSRILHRFATWLS